MAWGAGAEFEAAAPPPAFSAEALNASASFAGF